ncbi:casein kinase I [Phlyctochytrium planicorne]|nr:casein kinase I [Phlyctochytrium planicorne]
MTMLTLEKGRPSMALPLPTPSFGGTGFGNEVYPEMFANIAESAFPSTPFQPQIFMASPQDHSAPRKLNPDEFLRTQPIYPHLESQIAHTTNTNPQNQHQQQQQQQPPNVNDLLNLTPLNPTCFQKPPKQLHRPLRTYANPISHHARAVSSPYGNPTLHRYPGLPLQQPSKPPLHPYFAAPKLHLVPPPPPPPAAPLAHFMPTGIVGQTDSMHNQFGMVFSPFLVPMQMQMQGVPRAGVNAVDENAMPMPPICDGDTIYSDCSKYRWSILRHLGKGGCGDVYLAKELKAGQVQPDLDNDEGLVALKAVKDRKQFHNELRISRDFFEKTGQVHVDIKPSNFCVGRSGKDIHLIDFGYASLPHARLPGQTGTPLFMAVSIQTFGAVFMFFLGGGKKGLPWGHLRTHPDIARSKSDACLNAFFTVLSSHPIFHPMAHPLSVYLSLTRDRTRLFKPVEDYEFLLGLFEGCMRDVGVVDDGMYDWVVV